MNQTPTVIQKTEKIIIPHLLTGKLDNWLTNLVGQPFQLHHKKFFLYRVFSLFSAEFLPNFNRISTDEMKMIK